MLSSVVAWLKGRRPRPVSDQLEITCTEEVVHVRALEGLDASWNQDIRWQEIERVCFKDEGIYSSDIVFVKVRGRDESVAILMEARGGDEFFAQLRQRGFFPDTVALEAMRSTSGGMYCWPEE